MKITTLEQAVAVSEAGAFTMSADGYRLERLIGSKASAHVYNPEGRRYTVRAFAEDGFSPACNCRFFVENWQFKTCKHLCWAREAIAAEEATLRSLLENQFDWEAEAGEYANPAWKRF